MSSTQETSTRILGQVKWFNNKAGYGFITVTDGEHSSKDIFVHYLNIRVTNSQYKYLSQGEYVEFTLDKSNSDNHELQATEVSGVKGGKLMCEIRRNNLPQTTQTASGTDQPSTYRRYKTVRDDTAQHIRNTKDNKDNKDKDGEFTQVRSRKNMRQPPALKRTNTSTVSSSSASSSV